MGHMGAAEAAIEHRQRREIAGERLPFADGAAPGKDDLPRLGRIGHVQPFELGDLPGPVLRLAGGQQHIDQEAEDGEDQHGRKQDGADCSAPPLATIPVIHPIQW